MSFGGFLENNISTSSGGGGARIVADISYTNNDNNNNNMPTTTTLAHPRLLSSTPQPLSKSMFNSPGLSLALVNHSSFSLLDWYFVLFAYSS